VGPRKRNSYQDAMHIVVAQENCIVVSIANGCVHQENKRKTQLNVCFAVHRSRSQCWSVDSAFSVTHRGFATRSCPKTLVLRARCHRCQVLLEKWLYDERRTVADQLVNELAYEVMVQTIFSCVMPNARAIA